MEKVVSSELWKTVLCKNVIRIDFQGGNKYCRNNNCQCDELDIPFENLFEFYAHIFSIFDRMNTEYLASYLIDNFDQFNIHFDSVNKTIERYEDAFYFLEADELSMSKDLFKDIKMILQDSTTTQLLLVKLFSLLIAIDRLFGKLIQERPVEELYTLFPHVTSSGILVHKIPSSVQENFHDIENELTTESLNDPNESIVYQHIRNVTSISIELSYDSRFVKLQEKYNQPLSEKRLEEISIGFIPIELEFKNYQFDRDNKTENLESFNVKHFKSSHYSESLINKFVTLLKSNSDFIISSELNTELKVQNRLKDELKKENYMTSLIFPGTFHVRGNEVDLESLFNNSYINYSQTLTCKGETLGNVIKTNPYKEIFNGVEKVENISPGREIIFYDTHLGRIAVLICADLLNDNLIYTITRCGTNIVFVMAMHSNPSGGQFEDYIHKLGNVSKSIVIICNYPLPKDNSQSNVVTKYVYLPSKGIKPWKSCSHEIEVKKMGDILKKHCKN
ncbi:hypothetical protein [Ornithinibacillus halotolerans]|uniref:Uncharacterized protein n=1 Tax=Ornithinibacillus halotolerans TaxID=1274357 RepID=A0A916SBH0_9BACI|nr:hypothetical protein [Ornithinibacillus halotolerans]GGA91501.1 hypothetical protein GCM10008025_37530 [Ornithinibacillus halotolerans]